MLKVHKKEIRRIINDIVNLNPDRFILLENDDDGFPVAKLTVVNSEMSFWFRNMKNSWNDFHYRHTIFSPSYSITEWDPQLSQGFNFHQTSDALTRWLKSHAKPYLEEVDSVDEWNKFQFETDILNIATGSPENNRNFTVEESNEIITSIDNLKNMIIDKFNPLEDQVKFMKERLDYLSDATNRLGKFDWSALFISTMISIAVNMIFDKDVGIHFFELIKQAFSNVKNIIAG